MQVVTRLRHLLRGYRLWVLLGLVPLVPPSLIAARSYTAEVALFFPDRRPVSLPLGQAGVPGLREVQIFNGDDAIGAWYAPTRTGPSIILTHGAGGDRTQLLAEARALAEHGFGVLLFDWPGHGTSAGRVNWHDRERSSLVAALDWLVKQAETDPKRVGAIGFSLGGYILSQVATTDSRIRAMALLGTPSNLNDQVRVTHQEWNLLREPAARAALEWHGIDLDEPQPEQVIGQYARPLLVVGGTNDMTVPLALTQNLFRAARSPKALYVVPKGEHGNYAQTAPDVYLGRLVSHFRAALAVP